MWGHGSHLCFLPGLEIKIIKQKMDVFRVITIFIAFLSAAECYSFCIKRTSTVDAVLFPKWLSHIRGSTPKGYHYCTVYIKPSLEFSTAEYYLELSWFAFNVKDDMPLCSKRYVQVYLTRSYKSIGKFCTKNAAKPFVMYSHDGYAKITYMLDYWLDMFSLKYTLKRKSTQSLGFTACPRQILTRGSREVFSRNWPDLYFKSTIPCRHQIYRTPSYNAIKIVFMDLDLNTSPYPGDCIELRGSSKSITDWKHKIDTKIYTIDTKICSTSSIKTYTVYDRYIEITFNRRYSTYSNRGFVAGFISYNSKKEDSQIPKTIPYTYQTVTRYQETESTLSASISSGTLTAILVPFVVMILIVVVAVKCWANFREGNVDEEVVETHEETLIMTRYTDGCEDSPTSHRQRTGHIDSTEPVAATAPPIPAEVRNLEYPTGHQDHGSGSLGYPSDDTTSSVRLPLSSGQGVTFSPRRDQQPAVVPPIMQNIDVPNVPPPGYHDSPPGYHDSPPGYHDSPPGYHDSPPGYHDSPPGYHDSPSGCHDSPPPYI